MESFFENAVKPGPERLAAGFCFAAVNRDGSKRVQKSYGTTSIGNSDPFPNNPFIWIASMTKLATAIAALQCIEKGVFSLDDAKHVSRLVPELAEPNVISTFEPDGKNISTVPANTPITMRMLLTHVNGSGYDAVQPALLAWRASRGEGQKWMCGNLLEAYSTPLVVEPGTAFNYSPGLDWIGLMIERATGKSLGDYMQENIFTPLGMKDTLFDETTRPDLLAKLTPATMRPNETTPLEDGEMEAHIKPHCVNDFGGSGLYSTASDYLAMLSTILRRDNSLLTDASYDFLYNGSLDKQCKQSLNSLLEQPFFRSVWAPGLTEGFKCDFGASTLVIEQDIPGLAKAGTIGWISVTNCFWLIDPVTGYCGVFMLQLHPSGDMPSDALRRKVREYLWQEFGAK